MTNKPKPNLIRQVHASLPQDAPVDLARLVQVGVSANLAAYYVKHGWLDRLGQGVYAFPAAKLSADESTKLLQSRVQGLHVGGKSALGLQGVRHNLGNSRQLVLWGEPRLTLPEWFTLRFPSRYVSAKLFNWPDGELEETTIKTPPGATQGLRVAVPERAVLEMLYDAGIHESVEEARNLFDVLRNFRFDIAASLLVCCTSVKAVRLFLTWARETKLVDVDHLLATHAVPVGSNKRWMTRLKDGTLLSLKPNG